MKGDTKMNNKTSEVKIEKLYDEREFRMDKTMVFKIVTEVEGISAEDLETRRSFFCPICGKEEALLYLPNLICGVCDEHKTVWEEGRATQAHLYPLDVFLEMALSIYDHYYIDDKAREMIEGKDEVDLSEVAWTIGSIPLHENPMWEGFSAAIRFSKEDRMKRESKNSYEAETERSRKEHEEKGVKCTFIDGYGREVDKDGELAATEGDSRRASF
jgi:hypothetical protein